MLIYCFTWNVETTAKPKQIGLIQSTIKKHFVDLLPCMYVYILTCCYISLIVYLGECYTEMQFCQNVKQYKNIYLCFLFIALYISYMNFILKCNLLAILTNKHIRHIQINYVKL